MSICAGKLRKTILAFYAQTSDHVKRLSSPVANGKFSSISADTDTPWGRPEALRSVVTDLKVRSVCGRPRPHQPTMHRCCMQTPSLGAKGTTDRHRCCAGALPSEACVLLALPVRILGRH